MNPILNPSRDMQEMQPKRVNLCKYNWTYKHIQANSTITPFQRRSWKRSFRKCLLFPSSFYHKHTHINCDTAFKSICTPAFMFIFVLHLRVTFRFTLSFSPSTPLPPPKLFLTNYIIKFHNSNFSFLNFSRRHRKKLLKR